MICLTSLFFKGDEIDLDFSGSIHRQDIFEKRCHRNLCHISSRSIASTGHIGSGSTNAQGPQLFAFDEAMAMREVSPSSPLSSHLPSRPRVFQGYLDER